MSFTSYNPSQLKWSEFSFSVKKCDQSWIPFHQKETCIQSAACFQSKFIVKSGCVWKSCAKGFTRHFRAINILNKETCLSLRSFRLATDGQYLQVGVHFISIKRIKSKKTFKCIWITSVKSKHFAVSSLVISNNFFHFFTQCNENWTMNIMHCVKIKKRKTCWTCFVHF